MVDGVAGLSIADVKARISSEVQRNGIKLVIVDYLQKVRPSRRQEKRTYEVKARRVFGRQMTRRKI